MDLGDGEHGDVPVLMEVREMIDSPRIGYSAQKTTNESTKS